MGASPLTPSTVSAGSASAASCAVLHSFRDTLRERVAVVEVAVLALLGGPDPRPGTGGGHDQLTAAIRAAHQLAGLGNLGGEAIAELANRARQAEALLAETVARREAALPTPADSATLASLAELALPLRELLEAVLDAASPAAAPATATATSPPASPGTFPPAFPPASPIAAGRPGSSRAVSPLTSTLGRPAVTPAPAVTPLRTVDVVIVEDDRVLCTMVERALTDRGYTVAVFCEGSTALTALTGGAGALGARLVLLDLDLPGLDGLAVLRGLAVAGSLARLRVMALTARSGDSDVVEVLQAGAIDHISKPVSLPVLLARVAVGLQR